MLCDNRRHRVASEWAKRMFCENRRASFVDAKSSKARRFASGVARQFISRMAFVDFACTTIANNIVCSTVDLMRLGFMWMCVQLSACVCVYVYIFVAQFALCRLSRQTNIALCRSDLNLTIHCLSGTTSLLNTQHIYRKASFWTRMWCDFKTASHMETHTLWVGFLHNTNKHVQCGNDRDVDDSRISP